MTDEPVPERLRPDLRGAGLRVDVYRPCKGRDWVSATQERFLSCSEGNKDVRIAPLGIAKECYPAVLAFSVLDAAAASVVLLLIGKSFHPDVPGWYAGHHRHDAARRGLERSRGPANAEYSEGGGAALRALPWMRRIPWIGCDFGTDHVRLPLNVRGA